MQQVQGKSSWNFLLAHKKHCHTQTVTKDDACLKIALHKEADQSKVKGKSDW